MKGQDSHRRNDSEIDPVGPHAPAAGPPLGARAHRGDDPDLEVEEDDMDTGPPITDLFDFELETDVAFLQGVRRRIRRREMVVATADLCVVGASQIMWTYLEMFLEAFRGSGTGAGNRKEY